MKRRDLERRLRIAGCFLKREGGNHSIWMNPKNGIIEAVPRHNEIKGAAGQKDSETARRRLKNTDGKRHLDRGLHGSDGY
jgi:hypothetical protein